MLYLEEDIGGEHKGETDTGEEGQVGQPSLGSRHHEFLRQWVFRVLTNEKRVWRVLTRGCDLVIKAEQQARGEQGQQAAVKHLGDQNHVGPVDWKKNIQLQDFVHCIRNLFKNFSTIQKFFTSHLGNNC